MDRVLPGVIPDFALGLALLDLLGIVPNPHMLPINPIVDVSIKINQS